MRVVWIKIGRKKNGQKLFQALLCLARIHDLTPYNINIINRTRLNHRLTATSIKLKTVRYVGVLYLRAVLYYLYKLRYVPRYKYKV